MGRFSDKIKIMYLLMVILFAAGVFVYLLDAWGLIKLEERFPMLKKVPPKVAKIDDSPTLLDRERLRKWEERLNDMETRLKERGALLDEQEAKIKKEKLAIEQTQKGLLAEKKRMAETRAAEMARKKLITGMAQRLGSMPPDDAIAIVAGWSNIDLVDVLREMERTAAAEGRQSIVPFLMTKLPRDRAQVITSLMMDSEASRLPKTR